MMEEIILKRFLVVFIRNVGHVDTSSHVLYKSKPFHSMCVAWFRTIIEGVQRNKRTIFIPKRMELLFALQGIVPYNVKIAVMNFCGVGVLPHED